MKLDSQSSETPVPESAISSESDAPAPAKKKHRIGWAELLARVFAMDMKNLPHKPPDIAPPRLPSQLSFS